jgi:hypothetical protein
MDGAPTEIVDEFALKANHDANFSLMLGIRRNALDLQNL